MAFLFINVVYPFSCYTTLPCCSVIQRRITNHGVIYSLVRSSTAEVSLSRSWDRDLFIIGQWLIVVRDVTRQFAILEVCLRRQLAYFDVSLHNVGPLFLI
jgi:hypothetical protein